MGKKLLILLTLAVTPLPAKANSYACFVGPANETMAMFIQRSGTHPVYVMKTDMGPDGMIDTVLLVDDNGKFAIALHLGGRTCLAFAGTNARPVPPIPPGKPL